jgi:hypothetical protein
MRKSDDRQRVRRQQLEQAKQEREDRYWSDKRKRDAEAALERRAFVKRQAELQNGYDLDRTHWLNTHYSSPNTRHNSNCHYFNNTFQGRFCGSNEGVACEICGG